MPTKLEYPRASFKSCLELAEAVESLGGQCDITTCAAKLNKQVSGAFHALVGAAVKFGLIKRRQGTLHVTDAYEKMKLSYTEEERKKFLKDFFLNAPSFNEIYQKYKKVKLPIAILDKALIKEFNVNKKISQRVANYFIAGAKEVGLLNEDSTFNEVDGLHLPEESSDKIQSNNQRIPINKMISEEDYSGSDKFIVHIYGRGMNSKIEIDGGEDLQIVNAMINKIKKNLSLEGENNNH